MQLAKRLLGEAIVLLAAIALAVGVAHIVGPREFPEPGSRFPSQKMTEFYNRLIGGQLASGVAFIVFYYLLHKLYARWRARNAAHGLRGTC